MPPPRRIVVLARMLAIAFWTVAAGFGVYWIAVLDFNAGSFWHGLHEFSAGALLLLVSFQAALTEVKQTFPGAAAMSRLHQVGLALLHIAVGGFVTDTSRGGRTETKVTTDFIGIAMFAAAWVIAALKVLFALQPKESPADSYAEAPEAQPSSFSARRSAQQPAAAAAAVPEVRSPVAAESGRKAPWSAQSKRSPAAPPLLTDEERERAADLEQGPRSFGSIRAAGLHPDVPMWNPDAFKSSSGTADHPANPFGSD